MPEFKSDSLQDVDELSWAGAEEAAAAALAEGDALSDEECFVIANTHCKKIGEKLFTREEFFAK